VLPASAADDAATRTRLKELAAERRRFGWRRLKLLLERKGIYMNRKKLRRLYAEERLQVRPSWWSQASVGRAGTDDAAARTELSRLRELNQRIGVRFAIGIDSQGVA
jgi:hypothetical protein